MLEAITTVLFTLGTVGLCSLIVVFIWYILALLTLDVFRGEK